MTDRRAQLIEQTDKRYKKTMLKGAGIMLASALLLVVAIVVAAQFGGGAVASGLGLAAVVGFIAGLVVFYVGRSKQWWNHG